MFGKVYRITNTVNDKVYIGSTLGSLSHRFHRHVQKIKTGFKLQQAMSELGSENFRIELLQNFHCNTRDELREQEHRFIVLFDSINKGYNTNRAYVSKETKRMENINYCSDFRKIWIECACCKKSFDLSHKARHMKRHI